MTSLDSQGWRVSQCVLAGGLFIYFCSFFCLFFVLDQHAQCSISYASALGSGCQRDATYMGYTIVKTDVSRVCKKKLQLVFQKQKQPRETRQWKIWLMQHSMTEKQRCVGSADTLTKWAAFIPCAVHGAVRLHLQVVSMLAVQTGYNALKLRLCRETWESRVGGEKGWPSAVVFVLQLLCINIKIHILLFSFLDRLHQSQSTFPQIWL